MAGIVGIKALEEKAKQIRRDVLSMITCAGSGHPGGSLSAADLVVALYYSKMRIDPKNPKLPERDRFVMSKGHCVPLQYAILADLGYFPKGETKNLRKIGCLLQGHPCNKTPGIEVCTGSLGQGLSVANGMALAGKLDKKDYRVFVLLGDGECQEGQVWEAAMAASHYKLDNVIAMLDHNGLQIDGSVSEVMNIEPIAEKWKAFGWNVIGINGHDFGQMLPAIDRARAERGKPTIIIADTVKGKGVSFMESVVDYHGRALTEEELAKALKELA